MTAAIYIEAGHGAGDPGAVVNGLVERDLNEKIAARLVARLRAHGLRVHTDIEAGNPGLAGALADAGRHRSEIALYYAQHHNSFGRSTARGYEIYKTGTGRSWRFAKAVHAGQLRALRGFDPKISDRGVKEARGTRAEYCVLRSPGSSVLSELLFVSNRADAAIARNAAYVSRIAEATCKAIVAFGRAEKLWTTTYKPSSPTPPPAPADPCADVKRQLAQAQQKIAAARAALG